MNPADLLREYKAGLRAERLPFAGEHGCHHHQLRADMSDTLPEPGWYAPALITEDAYSAEQMRHEKANGAADAMAQACNELSAALGWPRGISQGPLQWSELMAAVAALRAKAGQPQPTCAHVWKVTSQRLQGMWSKCEKCGAEKESTWD
jgi:hypothetical protein